MKIVARALAARYDNFAAARADSTVTTLSGSHGAECKVILLKVNYLIVI